jgi:hypothetical protein
LVAEVLPIVAAPLIQEANAPFTAFLTNLFGLGVSSGGGSNAICIFKGLTLVGKVAVDYMVPAICFAWVGVAFALTAVGPMRFQQCNLAGGVKKAALATFLLAYSTLLKTTLTLTTVRHESIFRCISFVCTLLLWAVVCISSTATVI